MIKLLVHQFLILCLVFGHNYVSCHTFLAAHSFNPPPFYNSLSDGIYTLCYSFISTIPPLLNFLLQYLIFRISSCICTFSFCTSTFALIIFCSLSSLRCPDLLFPLTTSFSCYIAVSISIEFSFDFLVSPLLCLSFFVCQMLTVCPISYNLPFSHFV